MGDAREICGQDVGVGVAVGVAVGSATESVPGAGQFLEASSSTKTQSLPAPLDGGVNARVPVVATVSISDDVPSRGLYQYASAASPLILLMLTVNGCPEAL